MSWYTILKESHSHRESSRKITAISSRKITDIRDAYGDVYFIQFIICKIDKKYNEYGEQHTKLQVISPSGHCIHLDFHPPPEVQQPSPAPVTLAYILLSEYRQVYRQLCIKAVFSYFTEYVQSNEWNELECKCNSSDPS